MGSILGAYQGASAGSQFGMWGALGGAVDGYFGGPIFKAHMKRLKDWYTFPQLDRLQLSSPTVGFDRWLEQVPYADRLNSVLSVLNAKDNAAFQKTIQSVDPTIAPNVQQFGRNVGAGLRGELSPELLSHVQRSSAYQALQGGYGGSQMSAANSARNIGKTGYELQQTAAGQLPQQFQLGLALNPQHSTALDMFTTPQDFLQRDDRLSVYNNQIANQQKALDFASNIATQGGSTELLMNTIGGMYGGGRGGGFGDGFGGGGGSVFNSGSNSQSGGLDMNQIMRLLQLYQGGGAPDMGSSAAGGGA